MTPEELDPRDEACAREALRLTAAAGRFSSSELAAITAARLAREGWTPTDPLLIEAREIAAKFHDALDSRTAEAIRAGCGDSFERVTYALAALRRGKELAGGGE